jgi:hypothetical protein
MFCNVLSANKIKVLQRMEKSICRALEYKTVLVLNPIKAA